MNSKEFFYKVAAMRKAQKDYFKTRNTRYLNESKVLEKEIDEEIERVQRIVEERQNPELNFYE